MLDDILVDGQLAHHWVNMCCYDAERSANYLQSLMCENGDKKHTLATAVYS